MSFRSLVIGITFLALLVMGLRFSMDSDTWWQLRTGEAILAEGIPTADSWSYTLAGQPWAYPSTAWLSEAQLFLTYDALGPGGLNLWVAGLVVLAFALVYPAMSGGPILRFAVLILAAMAAAIYWAARPYMVSFVLSAAFLWILEDYRWGRRNRLIWLPALMVLWVNSHPGFAVGFILVGIYVIEQALQWAYARWQGSKVEAKRSRAQLTLLLLTSLGLIVAASLNPAGPAVLAYPFETVSIGVLRDYIQEWQSPDFHMIEALPFALLQFTTLGVLGASERRFALSDFLLLAVSLAMSFLAARNIPLFALIAAIVVSRHAESLLVAAGRAIGWKQRASRKEKPWQRWVNIAIFGIFAILVVLRAASLFPEGANQQAIAGKMPVSAVEYLERQQPAGNLFNSYNWGGYLIWNLRSYPVFVDGRTDLYDDGLLNEWLDIVSAKPGWQAALDEWDVQLVLLEPNWPLTNVLPYEGWQVLYQDEVSVLYGR